MTLIQAWIDSLTLFKPKNLQLFVMVTIKSIKEAYVLMVYYWSWLVVLLMTIYAVVLFFPEHQLVIKDITTHNSMAFVVRWVYQVLIFATCLATRPSIMQKNCAYFRSQMIFFGYFIVYLAIMPLVFWPMVLGPWSIWFILFFLDTEKDLSSFFISMWYALKMVIYNYPLVACMGICFGTITWLFTHMVFMPSMLQDMLAVLIMPIGVCVYANIYIKKLHDQFDVYFGEPQRDAL